MTRALLGMAAVLALACTAACEEAEKRDDGIGPGVEGEGEGPSEGEGEGPSEGEGEGPSEGEGEGPAEGEGEGPAEGEGEGPDQPPREVTIICGSIPDRVVQPDPLVVSATVVLPEEICAAHLSPLRNPHDPRLVRFVAVETTNAPPCEPVRRTDNIEFPYRLVQPDDAGEWTMEMIGLGPTIFRKTVQVDSAGAEPAEAAETCAGGRTGFVGACGEDIFCQTPSAGVEDPAGFVCNDETGLCEQSAGAGEVAGEFDVRLEGIEKACWLATEREIPPANCFEEPPELGPDELLDNPLEIAPAHLTLTQDPEENGNPGLATISFSGDSFLAHWSGDNAVPGRVVGGTFLGEEAVLRTDQGNCFHKYYLQLPSLTRYGDRVVGRLAINNLEANCGRGCLACELAGELVLDE